MQKLNKVVRSAIANVLTITAVSMLLTTQVALAAAPEMEKCYGITKAGMNDCATSGHSCAGSATQDKQPDAFIFFAKRYL